MELQGFDIVGLDWYRTQEEVENAIKNHIWITARRKSIPVREMSTSHIKNCIKCWKGKGKLKIPSNYLGGKQKWLKIFTEELINRQ